MLQWPLAVIDTHNDKVLFLPSKIWFKSICSTIAFPKHQAVNTGTMCGLVER